MKRRWSCFAVAVLWGVLCAPAWAVPPVTYARLELGQGEKSVVYLSFENNKMKLAPTLAGLDKATPVRAKSQQMDANGGNRYQSYQFAACELPVAGEGLKATATLNYTRSNYKRPGQKTASESVSVYGDVTLTQHGSDGTDWGYVHSIAMKNPRPDAGKDAQHPLVLEALRGDSSKLTLEIVTKVEGRSVRIGMQAKADKIDISNILKDGKPAPATLEVTDKDGKAIVKEKGDPQKFGFT